MAPEIMSGQGYTESVDIWSAGVLLYAMLSARFPFHGDTPLELKCKILKEDVDLKNGVWDKISLLAKDLISRMLVKDPQHRLNATQVLKSIHPYRQNATWQPQRILRPTEVTSCNFST